MTFDEIDSLVQANNNSKEFSNEFVICLIWKESGFDPAAKNSSTSATGLMQLTKGAVEMVNSNTPKGCPF